MSDHLAVWLIGAGPIAVEYAKVLNALRVPSLVIGRGERSAAEFQAATGSKVVTGGVEAWLERSEPLPRAAIVAVGASQLAQVTSALIDWGTRSILVEKPVGLSEEEIHAVATAAEQHGAAVYVALNRRFYASVAKARQIIQADGGVTSFTFEFTEWSHAIEKLPHPPSILSHWFLGNSTHVIDTAFFLGGRPSKYACYSGGGLDWHPWSIYAGAGVTETGALFSYHANWRSPGRWGIELLTPSRRLILRPLEQLQVQEMRSLAADPLSLEDRLDTDFKPGFFRQVEAFLSDDKKDLLGVAEHCTRLKYLKEMNGGYL